MGFAQAMIAAGDPPVLNLPEKGKVINESSIPSIFFSWTPRHLNSPAAAYGTEYEISLVEIYDKTAPPENAFLYSKVLYTETVRSTSFIHSAAQPMLIAGMRYAWRVRAISREGIEEVSVIKNNGYSPVYYFDYAADCRTVQIMGAVYENGHVNITWEDVGAMDYTVEYRKKGSQKWYEGRIASVGLCRVYNLAFNQEYEYRIGSRCVANDVFQYGGVKSFRTPGRDEKPPKCGVMPDVSLKNQTPVSALVPGLPFLAGDFPVFVTKATGTGSFTGEGYVGIPYLKNAQVAVTFKNIVVNSDLQLVSGYVETKYDAVNNNMLFDIDRMLTGGAGVGDIRSGEEKAAFEVNYAIDPGIRALPVKKDDSKDEIKEGGGNYYFTKGENGKYEFILTDGEGKEHKVEADEMPATIKDTDGNVFAIETNGTITQTINELKQEDNHQPIDTIKATQKVKDLIIVLQQRIREHLANSTDKYTKLAYENVESLSSLVVFDPGVGAGGAYKNGVLYVGTRNFKEGADDEDILATIYHEYMHYLNWQFGDRYRMENLVKGIIYSVNVPCFEKRMQTEDEFLDNAYQLFIMDKIKTPDAMIYLDYPAFYNELNDSQKKEVETYIKEKKIKPGNNMFSLSIFSFQLF